MHDIFDLLEVMNEEIAVFLQRNGILPVTICLSRGSYRRLVELLAWQGRIGNLVIGCVPTTKITTRFGVLDLLVDELLADTQVIVS